MIDAYNLKSKQFWYFIFLSLLLAPATARIIASHDDAKIFVTISLLLVFIFLGISSAKRLFLFLILLFPFQRYLGQFAEPLFKGTSFFLEIRSIINIFVIIYSIALIYSYRDKIKRFKDYFVAIPIILYLLDMLISTIYSPVPFFSLRAFFRLGMPFFCYFIGIALPLSQDDVQKLFKIILAASIIQLIWGLTDPFLLTQQEGEPYIRSEASLGHPNAFAAFLAMCFYIFAFQKSCYNQKLWSTFNGLIYLGALFINFILTIARSSWIAILVSIMVARRLFKLSFLSLLILFLLLAGLILSGPLWQRIEWRVVEERANISGRVTLNEFGWYLFKEKPLFGHGNAAYSLKSGQYFGSQFAQVQVDGLGISIGNNPHNEYMDALVGRGLIGIAIFSWLLFSVAKLARHLYKSQDAFTSNYGFMLIGMLVFIFVLSFFDVGFDYTGIWFWALVGIGESIHKRTSMNNYNLNLMTNG